MKKIVVFLFLIFSFVSNAQLTGEDEVYLSGDKIEPKFMGGGVEKFHEFVAKNFNFSVCKKEGKMMTSFTIDEEGNLKNTKIIQFVDIESATEMIRVLKTSPKWQPATKGGQPMSVEIKMPFDIVFRNEMKKEELPKQNINSDKSIETLTDLIDCKNVYSTTCVEVKPEFNTKYGTFHQYLMKNFKVPDYPGLRGKVMIQFVVEKDGSITDVRALTNLGHGAEEAAIKAIKKSPNWSPAMQNGKPVRCVFQQPFTIMNE